MRIGIWCDYGFTLGPTEGIGVFVDSLARGLVRADSKCVVTLKAHQGQESVLDSTVHDGLGRIHVETGPRMSRVRRRIVRTCKKIRRTLNRPTPDRKFASRLDRVAEYVGDRLNRPFEGGIQQLIQASDVWLLPYVGLEQDFTRPTVVAIHDLVCYHFPSMMSPAKLDALKRQVDRTSNGATLAACMSKFICQHDLLDTLHLPPSRVRVLRSAVPIDLGNKRSDASSSESESVFDTLPFERGTPFLFYPAAFRDYKNHIYLVEALALIKARIPLPWKVVFTGMHSCPDRIQSRIDQLGLTRDVVTLKKVSRSILEQIYHAAFATVVPSLYEQGSFPLLEALQCECPVASSNIASLKEQFAAMGSSMLYFDPHRPEELVKIVENIHKNRQQVIDSQRQGFHAIRQFTWPEAAEMWLEVFREAMTLDSTIGQMRMQKRAA